MKVLVTGSSRGLGLEFVRQLARRGEQVFATCRFPEEAKVLNDLQSEYPDLISVTELDVSDPQSIARSHNEIRTKTKSLDLLLNNAGIDIDDGGLGSFNLEAIQSMLSVNTIGPILSIQQYLDLLRASSHPKIVNISSRWGSLASLHSSAPYTYSASKTALNMYTRCLSHDLRDAGVIVIALSPGWVTTDMGGPDADINPPKSVKSMLQVVDSLTMDKSGGFYDYAGHIVPW